MASSHPQEQTVAAEPTVDPVAERNEEQVAEQSAEPLSATAQAASPDVQPQVVQNKAYAYYVVMGVFSSEQNAQRAVEQLRSNIKDAAAEVRPFGDKYMVTAFGSDKREECNVFVRSYHDIYPDLWIYNKK
ncbi:MAG: SPOR domain-containing protein [Rikenellaceae bacterium]|nr:SPOR domain-containing protein [Rikenellaceae bacterium]